MRDKLACVTSRVVAELVKNTKYEMGSLIGTILVLALFNIGK
jgi:hypothetical protein